MTSTNAQSTIDVLRHLFAVYGLPLQLVSDNRPQFISAELSEFLQENGVKHPLCTLPPCIKRAGRVIRQIFQGSHESSGSLH